MRASTLILRGLLHYRGTHLGVVAAVATAVGVLAGAFLVGESVRASLGDLFLARLGRTDHWLFARHFFREGLAAKIGTGTADASCPLIVLEGLVTHEPSGRRIGRVQVYGVDERFWRFHARAGKAPGSREILLSKAVTRELGAEQGDTVLLRLEKPSAVSAETLHGRKDDRGRTLRLSLGDGDAEFSLLPEQGEVRAAFVSLARLERDLELSARVNSVLLRGAPAANQESLLKGSFDPEDLSIRLRLLEAQNAIAVESEAILLDHVLADAARRAARSLGRETRSVLTYLANTRSSGEREIPYSLVSAIDQNHLAGDEIALNAWAARELDAKPGGMVSLDYYVWDEAGLLSTKTASFRLAGVLTLKGAPSPKGFGGQGAARDPDLAPSFPGISDSPDLSDWDPPFPIDVKRVRPSDEAYWDEYRTTPKAFLSLEAGQSLWQSRFGNLTSIRVFPAPGESLADLSRAYGEALRAAFDPLRAGFTITPVREEGLRASRGATDFGEYFSYFSFFLVVSALLLTGLSFKLGVEQRAREIGLLGALGFPPKRIRALFLSEGLVLAVAGSLLGVVVACGYAGLLMHGLRTWWVDAVGTTLLTLHVSPRALVLGGAIGMASALAVIALTLRGLRARSARELLAGTLEAARAGARGRALLARSGAGAALLSLVLLLASTLGGIGEAAGFFGAGALLLAALLCALGSFFSGTKGGLFAGHGRAAVSRLGFRNATVRPGRSLLSIALIALAVFIIVAVDAFRRPPVGDATLEPRSGTGGFPLLADSVLPLYRDPNSVEGREALNLNLPEDARLEKVRFYPFRVRPGDDGSCLNLYAPQNPRILAPPRALVESGRFSFRASLAATREERDNPWRLLEGEAPPGVVPAIADANSLSYVLHRKLGDEIDIPGTAVRLRFVAALDDSVLQGEILISEKNFVRWFPRQDGFRFFLLDAPREHLSEVSEGLERRLSDFGFDVTPTVERLASFHRVENTYLSTFQALGGLGLLLGTVGLAAVLLRNVLERRRELALLRAVGYEPRQVALLVLAENALLLAAGLMTGTVAAVVAIAPALAHRGGGLSLPSMSVLLLLVLASGILASLLAVAAAVRSPVLAALRTE